MPQPLCEVYGYPVDNFSPEAINIRVKKACPFNGNAICNKHGNGVSQLGACSVWVNDRPVITHPERFYQNGLVFEDAIKFLIPNATNPNVVKEATLKDADGENVGDIDFVIVDHDGNGNVVDFGALEIQAVYISGNIGEAFVWYIEDPQVRCVETWYGKDNRPDWLSSIKRLEHQLTAKGIIFQAWGKKMAIAIQCQFYDAMIALHGIEEVPAEKANVAWFMYDLKFNAQMGIYDIQLERTIYTTYDAMLSRFTRELTSDIDTFTDVLSGKLKKKLNIRPPRRTKNPNQ